jgi:hypothetical protein
MAFPFEDLFKKAYGLLSDTSGSAGDMSAEAAMPDTIGQQTSSLISSVPMKQNVGGHYANCYLSIRL